MAERVRQDWFGGPTAVAEPDESPAAAAGSVSVVHGVYAHSFPLAGLHVRDARGQLEERMNIDPDAIAVVDGNEVDEDTVLVEGQMLTFVKHAGEKGRVGPRTQKSRPLALATGPTCWRRRAHA